MQNDNCIQDEKDNDNKKNNGKKRLHHAALTIAIVLICIIAAFFIAWIAMDRIGISRLHNGNSGSSMRLDQAISNGGKSDTQGKDTEAWQDGWVRYNGSVYEYNQDVLTFLIMGIDNECPVQKAKDGISGGQMDAVFLLVMNPDDKKVRIMAINRNTMTDIDVYDKDGRYVGTGKAQICLAHGYGNGMEQSCERSEKAVSNLLYSLPIQGYCAINQGCIAMINDGIGGITVDKMEYVDGKVVKGAPETLTGEDAYEYITDRGDDFNSSSYRLEKQEDFIKSYMKKLMESVKKNPGMIVSIYKTIKPYIVTNVDVSEITYLADNLSGYTFDSNIYSMKGTVKVGKTQHEEFTYDEQQLYDMVIELFYKKVR